METALWTLLEKKVDSISSSFWSRTVLSCVIWVTNCMLATRGMLKVLRQTFLTNRKERKFKLAQSSTSMESNRLAT